MHIFAGPGHNHNRPSGEADMAADERLRLLADERLRLLIERIERLEAEKKGIADDPAQSPHPRLPR